MSLKRSRDSAADAAPSTPPERQPSIVPDSAPARSVGSFGWDSSAVYVGLGPLGVGGFFDEEDDDCEISLSPDEKKALQHAEQAGARLRADLYKSFSPKLRAMLPNFQYKSYDSFSGRSWEEPMFCDAIREGVEDKGAKEAFTNGESCHMISVATVELVYDGLLAA